MPPHDDEILTKQQANTNYKPSKIFIQFSVVEERLFIYGQVKMKIQPKILDQ